MLRTTDKREKNGRKKDRETIDNQRNLTDTTYTGYCCTGKKLRTQQTLTEPNEYTGEELRAQVAVSDKNPSHQANVIKLSK